jgi:integrase
MGLGRAGQNAKYQVSSPLQSIAGRVWLARLLNALLIVRYGEPMTKAANHMGSVYELTNGRWQAAVTNVDGKRKTRTTKTENQAKKALRELLADRDLQAAGGVSVASDLTVADVLDDWLQRGLPARRHLGKPLAPGTVYNYEGCAADLKREVGSIKVAKLRVRDLDKAFERLADGGRIARSTLGKTKNVLSMAFDFAIKGEAMSKNPATSITLPSTAHAPKVTKSLDVQQARLLIEEATGHRWAALFILALNLGLRPGELTALCWDHVDIEAATISVGRGARRTRSGGTFLTDEVKTARARRTLMLPPMALTALREHKARQTVDDLATGIRSDLVFRTSVGTIISARNLAKELQAMTTSLGFGSNWTPNELRHTAASLLVDQGVPLVIVADILGHTTTRMLEQTYRKNLRPTIDGAVVAMTNLFGDAASA